MYCSTDLGSCMSTYEENTRSFILRIWIEQSDNEDRETYWRGEIRSVSNKDRLFFEHMPKALEFIDIQVKEIGVELDWASDSVEQSPSRAFWNRAQRGVRAWYDQVFRKQAVNRTKGAKLNNSETPEH